ncbi:hypothetical protein SAY86_003749 [Trapa natans]|uniref:Uncharacterized protein n=1 Tax=Trapa natans TaxID=22666 RepID=A0AAN7MSQ6_TRANT|nr:hypothetical protein SAY86_003749 [Trapa natans]
MHIQHHPLPTFNHQQIWRFLFFFPSVARIYFYSFSTGLSIQENKAGGIHQQHPKISCREDNEDRVDQPCHICCIEQAIVFTVTKSSYLKLLIKRSFYILINHPYWKIIFSPPFFFLVSYIYGTCIKFILFSCLVYKLCGEEMMKSIHQALIHTDLLTDGGTD